MALVSEGVESGGSYVEDVEAGAGLCSGYISAGCSVSGIIYLGGVGENPLEVVEVE